MAFETEKDWTTESGLRAVCLMVSEGSHRCGYVEVPKSHPLHNVEYSEKCNFLTLNDDEEIGKRGIIPLMCRKEGGGESPECFFDVHGGITYSGTGKNDYPGDGGLWWFGFDCAHSGDATKYCNFDGDVLRTQDYVMSECENLARQLSQLTAEESAA